MKTRYKNAQCWESANILSHENKVQHDKKEQQYYNDMKRPNNVTMI